MSIVHIHSAEEFDEIIKSNTLVVCDFTASWCGPCRKIAPDFEQLAKQHPFIKFLKIDIDENAPLATRFDISSVPTFYFFKNGERVDEMKGANSELLQQKVSTL
eukprot:TRINITY_DN1278_c1_g1_i1.p1 TRINITY_DN1278_c1_g1~~TRINITY_DN1278_c1_g1_i1.p1  ORF type:complete len:113 (+),score=18.33 TRINITY_DN1278_c1_g1_i1:30-341(+)